MYYNINKNGYTINDMLNRKNKIYNILKMENMIEDNTENMSKDNIQKDVNNMPNEDTKDNTTEFQEGFIKEREMELMRKLYTTINTLLYPFVLEVLDEFEFIGSSIYSPMGIDRETISQMIDRVIDLAEEGLDEVGEAKTDRSGNYLREWDRWGLLRATVESLLLNDIFSIRRPNYFKKYAPNILK